MKKSRLKLERQQTKGQRGLHTHRSEQLLIEHCDKFAGDRLLCTTRGRAQFAAVASVKSITRTVICHFLDLYRCEESRKIHGESTDRLQLTCTADFPEQQFDSIALPLTATGESELAREQMQDAHGRLVEGGRLAVSTDNANDSFFHDEMQKLFPKVTRITEKYGTLYIGVKRGPLKKVRNFTCEFPFRDHGTLFRLQTRPGVFSHRRLDPGTRTALDAVTVAAGMTVLDLGCGAGPVALALAGRAQNVSVDAVDTNPRALACTRRAMELNGIATIRTHLNAEARIGRPGTVDLAVGNPPYFSKFRIAELFVASAFESLKPEGRLVIVTKQPSWFVEHLPEKFVNVHTEYTKNYVICRAEKAA